VRDFEYCRIIVWSTYVIGSIGEFFMKKWDEPAHPALMIALQLWVAKLCLN